MLKVFIDTNIFLGFYSLNQKGLDELKKIITLVDDRKIEIILSENVKDEFYKNRLSKIKTTIQDLKDQTTFRIPAILKNYEKSADFEKMIQKTNALKKELLELLKKDILDVRLGADSVVAEIFEKSSIKKIEKGILEKASMRVHRNLPPKKNREISIGDAVNWETLLKHVEDDIHIISDDGDFRESLEKKDDCVNYFLSHEWLERKDKKLFLYKGVTDFFNQKFETYKFEIYEEKKTLIHNLIHSGGFTRTHYCIAQLGKYRPSDFTVREVDEIMEAYLENPQISWILGDHDVKSFFYRITKDKKERINQYSYLRLQELIDPEDKENSSSDVSNDEIPF